MSTDITPFRIQVPQDVLDDLSTRLAQTRYPSPVPETGWQRGMPADYLRDLCDYWRAGYDWRAAEEHLNSFEQYTTVIDGLKIHFLHIRSPRADAVPLLLTHGWPGSFVEFLDVIGPLTNPAAADGVDAPAFHVVIPSLPGTGFSGTPETSWGIERIARAWAELMARLGYRGYIAQGGDWGMPISMRIGQLDAENVRGVHASLLVTMPPPGNPEAIAQLSAAEMARLQRAGGFAEDGFGFQKLLSTRPNTVSYALADSPSGLAAWIVEKFQEWSSAQTRPEEVFDLDRLLTNVMLYWVTGCIASSAQIYYEASHLTMDFVRTWGGPFELPVPVGVTNFQDDPSQPIQRWAADVVPSLVHWGEVDHGGHFGAMECPAEFVDEIRCFADVLASSAVRATVPDDVGVSAGVHG